MPDRWRDSFRIRFFPIRDQITWPRVGLTTIAVLGAAMHIFDAAIGAHASVRFGDSNVNASIGAGFGSKNAITEVVPPYISRRVGANDDPILVAPHFRVFNVEGFAVASVGNVPEVPFVDLGAGLRNKR